MGDHDRKHHQRQDGKPRFVPDFEIALWGYHRRQVDRCLADLTVRLELAHRQLDAVDLLQAQLCEAHLEIDQLRRAAEDRPSVANQLSLIMKTAEGLYEQAQREAEAVRAGANGWAGPLSGQ
jgi:hypothetical protein